ncbi:regulatory protein [Azorhizobium caulinodans ORS 571]|uniref:Regulatory protein n=1 Tax=Azorhizobium caulinodans (strain ATCC 43989 / DSM 5975 / JCM 20966 / LMG 6465 / NBRC 14845 / NCIMB 13405 / ORS 571) TaxID=438753 RepID=A8I0Z8_AZOC5|nr:LysR family transcriptional regulator [Azorhizobium caulinodans]BAF87314.1 regulatory protein [Azorhizobium caulinodans ORS 571]
MAFDSRLLNGIGVVSAVVEAGSFARAGEALGLTQPAVSRAVARLEQRIGIRIFNRTARSISLTDEGRRYYEAVAPLIAGIEDATLSAGRAKALVRGRLRVNVDGAFGHFVLTRRLGAFLDQYPDLAVDVAVRDAMGDLVGDGFDVAVRFGYPEPSNLRAELLLETRVLTCASASYIARYGAPSHPRDLVNGHQCVLLRDPSTGRPYEWEFSRGGETIPFQASGRLMVHDTGSLIGGCLGGIGMAQLLELYAENLLGEGKLVQMLPEWSDETFPLYAYHRASNLVSAKVSAFLSFVRQITR